MGIGISVYLDHINTENKSLKSIFTIITNLPEHGGEHKYNVHKEKIENRNTKPFKFKID